MTREVETLIIGSGVAAAAFSQEILQHDPKASILIVEAGDPIPMQDFKLWENFLLTKKAPYEYYEDLAFATRDLFGADAENSRRGDAPVELKGSRVMTLGGSTHHWGGWSFRMKPEDFNLRSNVMAGNVNKAAIKDCIDWPIKYDDLEPYYCLAEEYIGVSGDSDDRTVPRSKNYPFKPFPFTLEDQPVARAMDKLGYCYGNLPIARQGVNGGESDREKPHRAPCQTTGTCKYCPFGARYAAANFLDFMSNHESYDNFDIMTNCIVEEILMTAKNKACGISYRNRLGAETGEILAERVIVAAGAIESAKLLLRSKSGDWTYGLGNYVADGFVGRNFVFHPYFMFQGTMASNPLLLQPEMDFPTFCSRHFDTEAEQAKGKFILVNPPGPSSVKLADMLTKGQTKDQINQQLRGTTVVQLHGMVEFFSQSANRVSNCLKRNHLGLTETQVICNADEGVKERIVDIEEVVGKIFDGMGVSNLSLNTYSWRADHAASVCRMGRDESEGVVDKDLKIFGVDNVYVLSNAVFPSIGCVNPTLTLTALAIRLGRHLTKPGKVRGEEIALGAKQ